jgi:hypothetical protein
LSNHAGVGSDRQLGLADPVERPHIHQRTVVVHGGNDRFIIRRPSPGETIAGGQVVDPSPQRRHRRDLIAGIRNRQRRREIFPFACQDFVEQFDDP